MPTKGCIGAHSGCVRKGSVEFTSRGVRKIDRKIDGITDAAYTWGSEGETCIPARHYEHRRELECCTLNLKRMDRERRLGRREETWHREEKMPDVTAKRVSEAVGSSDCWQH